MRKALMALAVLLLCGPVLAENVMNAPWEDTPNDPRWQGGVTTSQTWESADRNHIQLVDPAAGTILHWPSESSNPFGTAHIQYTNAQLATAPGWKRDPVTGEPIPIQTIHIGDYNPESDPIGGGIDIYVPNDPTPRDMKIVHVQITSDKSSTGLPTSSPPGTAKPGRSAGYPGSAWYTYESTITIPQNPPFEVLHFDFPDSTDIAEIVVKSICVPEPATWALLATGAGVCLVGACRRRR